MYHICECVLSHVWLFAAPWTITHQVPLSMEFFRQECRSGLPFPPPGDLPDPWIEPASLESPPWAADSLPLVPPGKSLKICRKPKAQSMKGRKTLIIKIYIGSCNHCDPYTLDNIFLKTSLLIHMAHGNTSQNSLLLPSPLLSFLPSLSHWYTYPWCYSHQTRCPKFAIHFHTRMTALSVPSLRMSLSSALLVKVSSDSRVPSSSICLLSPSRVTDGTLSSATQTLATCLLPRIESLFADSSNGLHSGILLLYVQLSHILLWAPYLIFLDLVITISL